MGVSLAIVGVPDVGPGAEGDTLVERIRSTRPDSLFALWRMDEVAGTAAVETISGYNGTYLTGVTLAEKTNPNNSPAPLLANALNIYSTALRDAWPGSTVTVAGWFYGTNDIMTDAANARWLFNVNGTSPVNDYLRAYHIKTIPHYFVALLGIAGSAKQLDFFEPLVGWHHIALVVDTPNDRFDAYIDTKKVSATGAINDWTAVPFSSTTVIGSSDTVTPAQAWGGNGSLWAIWRAALTDAEIQHLYVEQANYQVMVIGDSKTAGKFWVPALTIAIDAATPGRQTRLGLDTWAVTGATVATAKTLVAAQIAASRSIPNIILINLGSNGGTEVEATFKADYRTLIETLHARWPNAPIYLARPVILTAAPPSTPTAANVDKRAWIDDLIAEYAYVYAGIDETALEGGNGYATNFTDVTHYTTAGQTAVKDLWLSALGYS